MCRSVSDENNKNYFRCQVKVQWVCMTGPNALWPTDSVLLALNQSVLKANYVIIYNKATKYSKVFMCRSLYLKCLFRYARYNFFFCTLSVYFIVTIHLLGCEKKYVYPVHFSASCRHFWES